MKHRYGLHHEDYAIGENEALYARMARKGWLLEKRGVQLSRYRACEPQALKFRIEFSAPDVLDESTALPEEQVSLYEDCGWTAVPSRGLAQVFYAPEVFYGMLTDSGETALRGEYGRLKRLVSDGAELEGLE